MAGKKTDKRTAMARLAALIVAGVMAVSVILMAILK